MKRDARPAEVRVEVLDAFERLGPEWDALAGDAPFLTRGWMTAWARAFGKRSARRIFLLHENGRPAGGAAFLLSKRTLAGLPVKALHFPGINIATSKFILPGSGRQGLNALMDRVLEESFQIVIARGVRAGGDHDRMLRDYLARRGLRYTARPFFEIYLDTSGGMEDYRKARRSKFWSNVRNRRRRLDKLGSVVYRREDSDASALLDVMCDVSLRSWKSAKGSALGQSEAYQEFFRGLVERGSAEGWVLRLDGKAIAYRLLATAGGVAAEVDIAYDEEYRKFSPGTLLSAHSNEVLVERGMSEINLGQDFPWKHEWLPEKRELCEIIVFRRGLYPRLLHWLHARRG